jgi:hypothetical protein
LLQLLGLDPSFELEARRSPMSAASLRGQSIGFALQRLGVRPRGRRPAACERAAALALAKGTKATRTGGVGMAPRFGLIGELSPS